MVQGKSIFKAIGGESALIEKPPALFTSTCNRSCFFRKPAAACGMPGMVDKSAAIYSTGVPLSAAMAAATAAHFSVFRLTMITCPHTGQLPSRDQA